MESCLISEVRVSQGNNSAQPQLRRGRGGSATLRLCVSGHVTGTWLQLVRNLDGTSRHSAELTRQDRIGVFCKVHHLWTIAELSRIARLLVCFQDLGSWQPGLDISPTHLCRGTIEARNVMTHQHYWLLEAPTNEPRPRLLLTSEHLAAHIRFRFQGALSECVVSSDFATPPRFSRTGILVAASGRARQKAQPGPRTTGTRPPTTVGSMRTGCDVLILMSCLSPPVSTLLPSCPS